MSRVNMFDVNFDNYDFNDLLEFIDTSIEHQRHSYILTCNVDHVIKLRKDDEFRKVYSDAGAVVADGMPIIWASKLLKKPSNKKCPGQICSLGWERLLRIEAIVYFFWVQLTVFLRRLCSISRNLIRT